MNDRYPTTRLRRNRRDDWTRRLTAETTLTADDLIWPIFLIEGTNTTTAVESMPGVQRVTLDRLAEHVRPAADLGIPAIALFPNIPVEWKDAEGSEATNPDNLMCRAARLLKQEYPQIGLVGDVALDCYTSHGHDGVIRGDYVHNDDSIAVLIKQALHQAQAGIDVIAPSDMMDGRVGAIRATLDEAGLIDTRIMSYAVKYASAFYGPFRDAVGTGGALKGDKKTYQMNPANTDEALREVAQDLAEGADMVMVKPGIAVSGYRAPGARTLRRTHLRLPGVRRIRDDRRRCPARLDRRRTRHDGEPDRLQTRRRCRGADLLRCGRGAGAAGVSQRSGH